MILTFMSKSRIIEATYKYALYCTELCPLEAVAASLLCFHSYHTSVIEMKC